MWRRVGPFLLLAGLLLAADEPKGPPAGDRDRLQGTWALVASELAGVGVPPAQCSGITLTFRSDTFAEGEPGAPEPTRGKFALRAGSPRAIDFTFEPDRVTSPAIYRLDGDRLRICFGDPRPESFDTRPGESNTSCTYRRKAAETKAQAGDTDKAKP